MPNSALQEVVCCVGQPVEGNPTQFMVQRALADLTLDWCCLTLEIFPQDLEDAIRGIRAMGFKGANLMLPHKVAVTQHLDALSESARLMGAVNCIYRKDDQLIGENTDGKGFVQSLRDVIDPSDKKVLLLGAGGAARAIAVELAQSGTAQITVANRTAQSGQELVTLLEEEVKAAAHALAWEGPLRVPEETDVLINATSLGVLDLDQQVPLDLNSVDSALVVADVVFNPPQTWLMREAAERGCTTLNGLGMLVNQAVLNLKIWTGRDPDPLVMREAVEEFLEI